MDRKSTLGKYNVLFNKTKISNSIIGDHTFVQKGSIVINAEIGNYCSIASMVCIGLGQHPTSFVSSHPAFYSSSQPLAKTFCSEDLFVATKRIVIGHDVWIGQNVMVMDGVIIGTGVIIGAGAVVTRDIPPYAIAVGVPAKVKGYRFDLETRSKLLETKWWFFSQEKAMKYSKYFLNPEIFLNKISNRE